MFQNSHLIDWINNEIRFNEIQMREIQSPEDIQDSGIIFLLFYEIIEKQIEGKLTISSFYQELNGYLVNQRKQKMNLSLRKRLLSSEPWIDIIKTMIYIAIHSQKKQAFIQRIMDMPRQSQERIMKSILEISRHLNKIDEREDLVQEIQKLEQSNEQLREIIDELANERDQLKMQCEQQREDVHKFKRQRQQWMYEKNQILQKLKLKDCEDMRQIFDMLQKDNEFMTHEILQLQTAINRVQDENEDLKGTLRLQNQALCEMKEELEELNDKYLKSTQSQHFNQSFNNIFSQLNKKLASTIASEFPNRLDLSSRRESKRSSKDRCKTTTNFKNLNKIILNDICIEREENSDEKIETYKKQIEFLVEENQALNQKLKKLQNKNLCFLQKMGKIRRAYNELMKSYTFG